MIPAVTLLLFVLAMFFCAMWLTERWYARELKSLLERSIATTENCLVELRRLES